MVTVAKMYYNFRMSQKEVAAELGISRGYVCQLLEQARNVGIVEIKVNDFSSEESELEGYVRKMFALRRVKIFPTPPHAGTNQLTDEIIKEACSYLDTIVKSGMTVGFSWGETIYQISRRMEHHPRIKNVTAIPLCGGISNLMKQIYVSEISTNIANAYNGTPLFIPLPAILQSREIRESLKRDSHISSLLETGRKADVALFTVGVPGEQNALCRSGYLDGARWEQLAEKRGGWRRLRAFHQGGRGDLRPGAGPLHHFCFDEGLCRNSRQGLYRCGRREGPGPAGSPPEKICQRADHQ